MKEPDHAEREDATARAAVVAALESWSGHRCRRPPVDAARLESAATRAGTGTIAAAGAGADDSRASVAPMASANARLIPGALRAAMEARWMAVRQLARAVDLHEREVANMLGDADGNLFYGLEYRRRIARVLGVQLDELWRPATQRPDQPASSL